MPRNVGLVHVIKQENLGGFGIVLPVLLAVYLVKNLLELKTNFSLLKTLAFMVQVIVIFFH